MIFSSDMSASCSSVSADAARQGEGLGEGARGKKEMMGTQKKEVSTERWNKRRHAERNLCPLPKPLATCLQIMAAV